MIVISNGDLIILVYVGEFIIFNILVFAKMKKFRCMANTALLKGTKFVYLCYSIKFGERKSN